jgi:hypothetical protein
MVEYRLQMRRISAAHREKRLTEHYRENLQVISIMSLVQKASVYRTLCEAFSTFPAAGNESLGYAAVLFLESIVDGLSVRRNPPPSCAPLVVVLAATCDVQASLHVLLQRRKHLIDTLTTSLVIQIGLAVGSALHEDAITASESVRHIFTIHEFVGCARAAADLAAKGRHHDPNADSPLSGACTQLLLILKKLIIRDSALWSESRALRPNVRAEYKAAIIEALHLTSAEDSSIENIVKVC